MTRNTTYDYSKADEYFNDYATPQQLSYRLMSAVIDLSIDDPGIFEPNLMALLRVVTDVRSLLESITQKGGSDE